MENVINPIEFAGAKAEKFFKATLFRGDALMLGLNCLEPGQAQAAHDHTDQDKFYYVLEGRGRFQIGDAFTTAEAGQLVWAPAGVVHGVNNDGDGRLSLLVGIAPAP